jgi:hypothetical protein
MSSPYPSLQSRQLPCPEVWDITPPPQLKGALEPLFKPLQTTYPGMIRFAKTSKQTPFLRFDHKWHLEEFSGAVPSRSGSFSGKVRQYTSPGVPTETLMDISGFCKITHLLDAYRMMQGNYPVAQHPALPSPGRKSAKVYAKLHDPHNQAYVDAVACYMLSKFREADHSPHFSLFYGSYLAIAKDYYYNITEEFHDLRFEGWFWRKQAQGQFRLVAFRGEEAVDETDSLMEAPEDISENTSRASSHYSSSGASDVSELYAGEGAGAGETASLHSASITTASESSSASGSESGSGSGSGSESTSDSEWSEDGDYPDNETKVFAALSEFPTMMIFLESNRDTMDSLMENPEEVGAEPGTPEWETRWSAWLFQVAAALCQIQSLWAMTHNDLHGNNILWSPTDKEFFFYRSQDGKMWKVPTYGKVFRIIDFGRAIYTHNNTLCISDDYLPDNEAGSQYNFGPIYDPTKPRSYPNPSFDLSRLSVSILEALFEEIPEDREGGGVLSEEIDRKQMETVSDLYNLLWGWLIDNEGRNILWDGDQSERYPGFDLYTVIAQKVKGAIPREQLEKAPFSGFIVPPESVPETDKVYSLYC